MKLIGIFVFGGAGWFFYSSGTAGEFENARGKLAILEFAWPYIALFGFLRASWFIFQFVRVLSKMRKVVFSGNDFSAFFVDPFQLVKMNTGQITSLAFVTVGNKQSLVVQSKNESVNIHKREMKEPTDFQSIIDHLVMITGLEIKKY